MAESSNHPANNTTGLTQAAITMTMAPDEQSGYENEPVEMFRQVPEQRYPELYHLHAQSSVEESRFYQDTLDSFEARQILELGCGTGRIAETLYLKGFTVVGIDISRSMLTYNRRSRQVPVAEMDMCALGFTRSFDGVIIPCNSLNLLLEESAIRLCLKGIIEILGPRALLIVQLFVPNEPLLSNGAGRLFQFQSCELAEPGKLVKETIRFYNHAEQTLELEERYKIRPYDKDSLRENYSRTFKLAAFSADRWMEIITDEGFTISSWYGSFSRQPFQPGLDSTLLMAAHPTI